jgi:hypothetical protein
MARAGVGFTIAPERVRERAVADGLVARGNLAEIRGVDGGYTLSDEMARALAIDAVRRSEGAVSN